MLTSMVFRHYDAAMLLVIIANPNKHISCLKFAVLLDLDQFLAYQNTLGVRQNCFPVISLHYVMYCALCCIFNATKHPTPTRYASLVCPGRRQTTYCVRGINQILCLARQLLSRKMLLHREFNVHTISLPN